MEKQTGMESMVVLITGGTGFIGSHLTKLLTQKGYQVIASSHKTLNITNKKRLFEIVKKHHIDYIIHLAAKTIVNKSVLNPALTLNTNIIGTVNVLEAARTINNIKGVIIASSDKAYGKIYPPAGGPYIEDTPLKGDHPYDVSKSSADLIAQAYIKTYQTPVIITRSANVYGEGDTHEDRIIPAIIDCLKNNKVLKIRSNGLYKRDYVYVKDVASAYYFLLKNFKKCCGQAYNISSKENYSVLGLIKKIEKITGKKIKYKILNSAQNEIPYQKLNDSKLRSLGWQNHHSLLSTIKDILISPHSINVH